MEIYVYAEIVCAGLTRKNAKGPPEERMLCWGLKRTDKDYFHLAVMFASALKIIERNSSERKGASTKIKGKERDTIV
jgi:hypothetical protein